MLLVTMGFYSIVTLAVVGPAALAETYVKVKIPLIFPTENDKLLTSACLAVSEHTYKNVTEWEQIARISGSPEQALSQVLSALTHGEEKTVNSLSAPAPSGSEEESSKQVQLLSRQLSKVEVVGVRQSYRLRGFLIFFVAFRNSSHTFYSPFLFRSDGKTHYFLPSRSQDIAYKLLVDWFDSKWGPSGESSTLCGQHGSESLQYRIPLPTKVTDNEILQEPPDYLYVTGSVIGEIDRLPPAIAKAALSTKEISLAADERSIKRFTLHMSSKDRERTMQWFSTADDTDRAKYFAQFSELLPVFSFDLQSFVVIYAKGSSTLGRVFYFQADPSTDLIWTNVTLVTLMDTVFKRDSLYKEAAEAVPFGSVRFHEKP